jgi:hypothetical protein
MKRSISNNKKSPVNVNNNENEIDVNVLLNDPKSLHKMLNKKSDDNDNVPANVNRNRPRKGHQYELGNIKSRTERKLKRIGEENLEKLKAMRPVKKKEEVGDIPEFAPYAKKKYNDKREYNRAGELLNKGVTAVQDTAVKGYDKGKELISDFIKDTKKDGVVKTIGNTEDKIKAIIHDYIKDNKFLHKANNGAKKVNKFLGIDKYLNKEKEHE